MLRGLAVVGVDFEDTKHNAKIPLKEWETALFSKGEYTKRNATGQDVFGSLKGGEGFFKRPTGISIDAETHRVYVTDTLRDKVYILDADGRVLRTVNHAHGAAPDFGQQLVSPDLLHLNVTARRNPLRRAARRRAALLA